MNPVHQNEDGKWYFWDETQAYEYGPYNSEEEANVKLDFYCAIYLNECPEGCLATIREAIA